MYIFIYIDTFAVKESLSCFWHTNKLGRHSWYNISLHMEIDMMTWVQILDEDVYISHGKGMNTIIFLWAIVRQTEFINFGMTSGLGEEKLWIQIWNNLLEYLSTKKYLYFYLMLNNCLRFIFLLFLFIWFYHKIFYNHYSFYIAQLTRLRIFWLYLSRGVRLLLQESYVIGMTLNCIWWWSSSLGDWGSVEYTFIAITSRSTLTHSSSTC